MPFARWPNFQACVNEQIDTGHDEESAKKICGFIQARAEKGELLKAEPMELDILAKADEDGELVVGGYSTYELRDPQNDIITTQAQVKFLQRLFKLPPEYQQITVKHGDFKIGTPLLKYTNKKGEEFFSHVNEKGTYLISKIRKDNFKSTSLWREKIQKGELAMYSISGLPLEQEDIMENGEKVRKVLDLEPWAVTLCERGVNPKAQATVISKEHNIRKDGLWGGRGPGFDNCVAYQMETKGIDQEGAKKLCAYIGRQAGKIAGEVGELAYYSIVEKMTFEECVAEASKNPDVKDPEALCGWLNYHGPNAPMHHKSVESLVDLKAKVEASGQSWEDFKQDYAKKQGLNFDVEEILRKHGFDKCKSTK